MRKIQMLASMVACLALATVALGESRYEHVIPLKVVGVSDLDAYARVFSVPVVCNGVASDFTWNCAGPTRVSESFARESHIAYAPDVNSPQDPLIAGSGTANIEFAGHTFSVGCQVIRDSAAQDSEKNGVIGYDIAQAFQWTMDPSGPTLTIRPPGTPPTTRPIATLPLKDSGYGVSLNVKIRNVAVDVTLFPSSMFIQAAPDLQHKWDMDMKGKKENLEIKMIGDIKILMLRAGDNVTLAPGLVETDMPCAEMGDPDHPEKTPEATDCIGQCLLNRFIYTVEPEKHQFWILARLSKPPAPPTQP